nr:MAG TPA: hypothetical protein [Caudoviricetes sp.]
MLIGHYIIKNQIEIVKYSLTLLNNYTNIRCCCIILRKYSYFLNYFCIGKSISASK